MCDCVLLTITFLITNAAVISVQPILLLSLWHGISVPPLLSLLWHGIPIPPVAIIVAWHTWVPCASSKIGNRSGPTSGPQRVRSIPNQGHPPHPPMTPL